MVRLPLIVSFVMIRIPLIVRFDSKKNMEQNTRYAPHPGSICLDIFGGFLALRTTSTTVAKDLKNVHLQMEYVALQSFLIIRQMFAVINGLLARNK